MGFMQELGPIKLTVKGDINTGKGSTEKVVDEDQKKKMLAEGGNDSEVPDFYCESVKVEGDKLLVQLATDEKANGSKHTRVKTFELRDDGKLGLTMDLTR